MATRADEAVEEYNQIYADGWITTPFDQYNRVKTGMARQTNNAVEHWLADVGDEAHGTTNGDGAELIGIITGRNKFLRTGGGSLNIEAKQLFGANSYETAFASAATATVIGSIIATMTGATFKSNNARVAWGNSSNDPDSFGVTAMHVKVYDHWPESQTLFVAPYFTVFHFNNGIVDSFPDFRKRYFEAFEDEFGNNVIDWNKEITEELFEKDKRDTNNARTKEVLIAVSASSVDVRIPAIALSSENDFDNFKTLRTGSILSLVHGNGEEISTDKKLRLITDTPLFADIAATKITTSFGTLARQIPEKYWSIDTNRRGKMLTGIRLTMNDGSFRTGYIHAERYFGLDMHGLEIKRRGLGFTEGEEFDLGRGVKIKITKTKARIDKEGDVVGQEIDTIDFVSEQIDGGQNFVQDTKNQMRGTDFRMNDIEGGNGLTFTISPQTEGGSTERATIIFKSLIVHEVKSLDLGPREHTTGIYGKVLTDKGDGRGRVEGVKTTQISLLPNETGEYEAFYYFHNDISHNSTEMAFQNGGISVSDFVQNVTIKIS